MDNYCDKVYKYKSNDNIIIINLVWYLLCFPNFNNLYFTEIIIIFFDYFHK